MGAPDQLRLGLNVPLSVQFPTIESICSFVVSSHPKGIAWVAGEMDMSPSDLSKRTNPDGQESRPLRARDLIGILRATGDARLMQWISEQTDQGQEDMRTRAAAALVQLAPVMLELASQAGLTPAKAKR